MQIMESIPVCESTRRRIVPQDGYVDNPSEVNKILLEYALPLNYRNLGDLVTPERQKSECGKLAQREIDALLSKDLLKLSMDDRNAITEEIHGVQTIAPEENPLMIQSALRELVFHIEELPTENKTVYLRSWELYPNSYIHSANFRLRFLRCDLFDAKKAAIHIVDFLDLMSDLFGDYVLKRPVQIADFSWEEMQVLRRGHFQLLPYRDRSGRRIFAFVGGLAMGIPLATKVKLLIYLLLSASEDVESQRRGITSIVLPGSKFSAEKESSKVNLDRLVFMKRIYSILPIRTSAIHLCLPNTPFINVFRASMFMTMSNMRNRMRFHSGNSVEVQYILKGYGIPVELIPLTDTGNIKTIYLKQWIKLRKCLDSINEMEHHASVLSVIECPGSRDVVFRPGTSVSYHPGNVRFRCLLESITTPEVVSLKLTQAQMAERLIRETNAIGGRFLKWDNNGYWTQINDLMQVHTKVALSIRDYKYKTKMQRMNHQRNDSVTYLFCQEGSKRKREDGISVTMNRNDQTKKKI